MLWTVLISKRNQREIKEINSILKAMMKAPALQSQTDHVTAGCDIPGKTPQGTSKSPAWPLAAGPWQSSALNPQVLPPQVNLKFAPSAPAGLYLAPGLPWRIFRPCRTLCDRLGQSLCILNRYLCSEVRPHQHTVPCRTGIAYNVFLAAS